MEEPYKFNENSNIVNLNPGFLQNEILDFNISNNHDKTYQEIYKELDITLPSQSSVASVIANILEEIVKVNEGREVPNSIFNSKKIPGITIANYLQRIVKYARLSFETLILGIIYLDRMNELNDDFFINKFNVHK